MNIDRMNEIIDGVWLGDFSSAVNVENLKKKGIKKILSVMIQFGISENGELDPGPNYKSEDGFIHKRIDLFDVPSENVIKYFGECLNFIDGNEKVLVHCMAGASRSATIVIAYLMWKKKMKFDEAFCFVQKKRSIVPNYGFKQQLKLFEKELEKNEYDINKINFGEIKWKLNYEE